MVVTFFGRELYDFDFWSWILRLWFLVVNFPILIFGRELLVANSTTLIFGREVKFLNTAFWVISWSLKSGPKIW